MFLSLYDWLKADPVNNGPALERNGVPDYLQVRLEILRRKGILHSQGIGVKGTYDHVDSLSDAQVWFGELLLLYQKEDVIRKKVNEDFLPCIKRWYSYRDELSPTQWVLSLDKIDSSAYSILSHYKLPDWVLLHKLLGRPKTTATSAWLSCSVGVPITKNPEVHCRVFQDVTVDFFEKTLQAERILELHYALMELRALVGWGEFGRLPLLDSWNRVRALHEEYQQLREAERVREIEDYEHVFKWPESLVTVAKENGWYLPSSLKELQARGTAHRNCVGGYSRIFNPGSTVKIFFTEDKEAEISFVEGKWTIIQCKGRCNTNEDQGGLPEIRSWLSTAKENLDAIR